jgi:hypothetical protein
MWAHRAIGDAVYIETLRRHPSRVEKINDAKIQILSAAFALSYYIPDDAEQTYGCVNLKSSSHVERVSGSAKSTLQKFFSSSATTNTQQQQQQQPNTPRIVLFCSGCNEQILGNNLFTNLKRSSITIASQYLFSDYNAEFFVGKYKATLVEEAKELGNFVIPPLVLPTPHRHLHLAPVMDWNSRPNKLAVDTEMEWTDTSRKSIRQMTNALKCPYLPSFGVQRKSLVNAELRRAKLFGSSQFCAILHNSPWGFQSVFDAIAYDCIPVFLFNLLTSRRMLPFSFIIPWDDVFFGVESENCIKSETTQVTEFLVNFMTGHDEQWKKILVQLKSIYETRLKLPEYVNDYRFNITSPRKYPSVGAVDTLLKGLAQPIEGDIHDVWRV